VNPGAWASVCLPGECTNTEDARREFKFENGSLLLVADNRELYATNSTGWVGVCLSGEYTNTDDARRKFKIKFHELLVPRNGLTFWLSAKRGVELDHGNLKRWSNPLWPEGQFEVIPEFGDIPFK
jgi:hypothetical protein